MFDALNRFISSLSPLQIQEYTAFIVTITFVMNLIKLIYDLSKDRKKIKVTVKRDDISLAAKQHPHANFLIFEIVNQGSNPIIINELGIITKNKQYFNIVDVPWAFLLLNDADFLMGSIKWTAMPGTLNSGCLGIAHFSFSILQEAYTNIKRRGEPKPQDSGYLGTMKCLQAYNFFWELYDDKAQIIKLQPYIITNSGNRFIGRKSVIRLGNLHTNAINSNLNIS